MTEGKRFAQLLKEFERVGVDPNTISAGLAVREEDALRALHALPDNAGPAAFLTQLRLVMSQATAPSSPSSSTSHAPPREYTRAGRAAGNTLLPVRARTFVGISGY